LRSEILPALSALPATNLENVGEVRGDPQLHPILDWIWQIVCQGEPLEEPIGDDQLAADVHAVLRVPVIAAEFSVRNRQVNAADIAMRCLHREQRRRTAGDPQLIVTQDTRIILEEAE
jgi:hypothetical protein